MERKPRTNSKKKDCFEKRLAPQPFQRFIYKDYRIVTDVWEIFLKNKKVLKCDETFTMFMTVGIDF